MEAVVLRPPTAYGRGAPFAPVLVRTLLSRPPATMPAALRRWPMQWVHVDDLVGAIVAAAYAPAAAGQALNVAGPELFGMRRLNALLVATLAGLPAPAQPAAAPALRFDLRRAARALGYRPAIPLAAGFPEMVEEVAPPALPR
jgi:nucleoside-diphosphate-sugar epimerase